MEEIFPKLATILVVIWLIWLSAMLVVIVFFRHKLIDGLLRLGDDRQARIIQNDEKLIKLYRLMLWFSPVYLIFVPLAIYYTLPEWTIYHIIIVLLVFASTLLEYVYTRWILTQLKPHPPPAAQDSKNV
jgi:hypothetical protein